MFDVRKVVVVLLIAVLFSVFVFTTIKAIYPSPSWSDYCDDRFGPQPYRENECPSLNVSQDDRRACEEYIDYEYDSNGCPTEYFCNVCPLEYNEADNKHSQIVFYVTAVLSLIAIFVGLTLPEALNDKKAKKRNDVHEWVGSGLLLGGAIVLLIGTVMNFDSLDRFVKAGCYLSRTRTRHLLSV